MSVQRVQIIITGRVQGVGFRHFIRSKAEKLDLKGFVRNTNNKVEVNVEGSAEKIEELIQSCKRGPFLAEVADIQIKEEPYKGEWKSFTVEK